MRRLALLLVVAAAAGCGGTSTPKLVVNTPKLSKIGRASCRERV